MKRSLSILLILVLVCGLALTAGAKNKKEKLPSMVNPDGLYITITTLIPGHIDFQYGYKSSKPFKSTPHLGYFVSVYNPNSDTHMWSPNMPSLEPIPKHLRLCKSLNDTRLVSGQEFQIQFEIVALDDWGDYSMSLSSMMLQFTIP
jgi:hypothetical protein